MSTSSVSVTEITSPYVDFGNPAQDSTWTTKFTATDREKLYITQLKIGWDGSHITLIQCAYNEKPAFEGFAMRGQTSSWVVQLSEKEWVTKFEASSDSLNVPNWVRITTNLNTYGPYGVATTPTNIKTLAPGKETYGLLWLEGKVINQYVTSIQAIWTEKHEPKPAVPKHPAFLKYYSGHPGPFSVNLTPLVTLAVGNPPTRFTIHQGLLDPLPFFTNGSGTDSTTPQPRDIAMPNDTPILITAFLECLSTGSYTYEHDYPPPSTDPTNLSFTPPPDLLQGKFHIDLYATAIKYECHKVSAAALEAARYVLDSAALVESPGDTLELLKAAYASGSGATIHLLAPEGSVAAGDGPAGLRARIAGLGKARPGLLRQLAKENPDLAGDLLELLTS